MKTTYRGTLMPCGNREPHDAHVLGTYSTVRWGLLQRFCVGVGQTVSCVARGSAELAAEYEVTTPSQAPAGGA